MSGEDAVRIEGDLEALIAELEAEHRHSRWCACPRRVKLGCPLVRPTTDESTVDASED